MGMYDNIEDYQVKCFYVPMFSKDEYPLTPSSGIYTSGGRLRYFKKGQKVPYKTFYYDYSPNFAIYDYGLFFEEEIFIVIKNGKITKIIDDINKVTNDDFKGINNVINYVGSFLNIKNVEDISKYREDFLYYQKLRDEITKKQTEYLNLSFHYMHMKNERKPLEEGLTKEEAEKLSHEYLKKHEIERDKTSKEIDDLRKNLLDPWFAEPLNEEENDLGCLIECFPIIEKHLLKKPSAAASEWEIEFYERNIDNYHYLLIEFNNMIQKNDKLIDNFLELNKDQKNFLSKEIKRMMDCYSLLDIKKEEDF